MGETGIFEKVRMIVADKLTVDLGEVKPEAAFQEDLGADSLALVELIMALEEGFDIANIPDDDANRIKTVGDAVRYLEAHLAPSSASES